MAPMYMTKAEYYGLETLDQMAPGGGGGGRLFQAPPDKVAWSKPHTDQGPTSIEYAVVSFIPETPRNRNYRLLPRGVGSGNLTGCFSCDDETSGHDCACFVANREIGEAIVVMFGKGAYLDFRETEPNWVQVKIHSCAECLPAFEKLVEMMTQKNGVSAQMVETAREETGRWTGFPDIKDIIHRLERFLATRFVSDQGGGWPKITEQDFSVFCALLYDIRDAKWSTDADGDHGVTIEVVDRTRWRAFPKPRVPSRGSGEPTSEPLAYAIKLLSGQLEDLSLELVHELASARRKKEEKGA